MLSQLRSIEYCLRIEIKHNPKVLALLEVVLQYQKSGLRSVMVVEHYSAGHWWAMSI